MSRCLFTYEKLANGEQNYSDVGLKKLSKKLLKLELFPYSQEEQILVAQKMANKISIQGVQPKFSVLLDEKEQVFKEAEKNGQYILKPQVSHYKQLPENEDLTMNLVAMTGVEVPWHGLVRCSDDSLSYVVKRFDRVDKTRISMEDFSQLIGATRDTKYDVSFEKVAETIQEYCSYPTIEWFKLYQRIILAFLLGNEDFHLKNLSVVTTEGKVQLSPVYDFVNTTIINQSSHEEMALSICGKKTGLTKEDLLVQLGEKNLFLPKAKIEKETKRLISFANLWIQKIDQSFIDESSKRQYKEIILSRCRRLA